jgi:mono/diheme cytochrome c family protein
MRRFLLLVILSLPAAAVADDAGKATYDKMCASCHGPDGKGNPDKAKALKIDPNLLNLGRPEGKDIPPDKLKEVLLNGKEKMPGYAKKLKPAEVDPVLDYAIGLAKAIRGEK